MWTGELVGQVQHDKIMSNVYHLDCRWFKSLGEEVGGGTLGFQVHPPFHYLDPQTGPTWILLVVSGGAKQNFLELRIQLLERRFFNCLQDL
jgi:hypothetical protein